MEFVSGIKLRNIFLDNGNWWKLFLKHRDLIRISIITNVLKLLVCRTTFLGFHLFTCPTCFTTKKVPHSCKSRFCSSCGKKATDNWIKNAWNTLPHTTWQHITFTMPQELWDFFAVNRQLLNKIPSLAAHLIISLAKQQGFLPGIYLALHTFGRDLKFNVHLHLSTTAGGLTLDRSAWKNGYFPHVTLKELWKYHLVSLLQTAAKNGSLKMPPHLKHIKTYPTFCSWMTHLYRQTWVVHLNQQTDNHKLTIHYLGKYLKRPPIGETRITHYDGNTVTYYYLDHYTKTTKTMTLPVSDFIARLIRHIPDHYFRTIRYYGFLATRVKSKLLPIVATLLSRKPPVTTKVSIPWRTLIKQTFHSDPLVCPHCQSIMKFTASIFTTFRSLTTFHKEIAHGYFPLLL